MSDSTRDPGDGRGGDDGQGGNGGRGGNDGPGASGPAAHGPETDREQIAKLVDGELPWEELRNDVLPDPKDPNRFQVTRAVLQERAAFDEPILVPLSDHLYAVGRTDGSGERLVKAECGHELCSLGDNWKTACRVRVRESAEEMGELYPESMGASEDWDFQLREWLCPGCLAIVDVDAVPVGYPVYVPFEPDVDAFYEEWLEEVPPDRR